MAKNSRDSEILAQGGEIQVRDGEIMKFISTLPTKEWIGIQHLHQYMGFWFVTKTLHFFLTVRSQIEPKENDVLLATLPKAGTIWLKALLFSILNRKNHPINQNQNHPLLAKNPHVLVPFIDSIATDTSDFWSTLPSLYATHFPRSLLPADAKCKIVYLCRNLKDVFVSYWHFFPKMGKPTTNISLEECFESFCQGVSAYGPVWDHILGYWKASLEKPDKVMFLRYEEMKKDPVFHVKRMAAFVGSPITAEEEEKGLVDDILKLCSFDHLSNLDINKNGKWVLGNNKDLFRKGEVGDWKNHLTSEMAERLDQITEQKLQGTGLKL